MKIQFLQYVMKISISGHRVVPRLIRPTNRLPVAKKTRRGCFDPERFRAKWIPVRVKKMRQNKKTRAFSSEVGTGSRQENASK
jgi:hypothetical protein